MTSALDAKTELHSLTIDRHTKGNADLAHPRVAKSTNSLHKHRDRHTFDRIKVDNAASADRIVAGVQHYFTRKATNSGSARRNEGSSKPRDGGVTREDNDGTTRNLGQFAPPDFCASGRPIHDAPAALRNAPRLPQSSSSSIGVAS